MVIIQYKKQESAHSKVHVERAPKYGLTPYHNRRIQAYTSSASMWGNPNLPTQTGSMYYVHKVEGT